MSMRPALLEIDIATGQHKVIAEDPQFDVPGMITQPKTNALEVVTFVKQRVSYDFIDPQIKADYEALQKVRPWRYHRHLAQPG